MRRVLWTMTVCAAVTVGCGSPVDLKAARRSLGRADAALARELARAEGPREAELRAGLTRGASPGAREAVVAGEIFEGMPAADALRAWGEPDDAGRPWFVTYNLSEWWRYRAAGRPDLEVWLRGGRVLSPQYRVTGHMPEVPRGPLGWTKRWPAPEDLRDSRW